MTTACIYMQATQATRSTKRSFENLPALLYSFWEIKFAEAFLRIAVKWKL